VVQLNEFISIFKKYYFYIEEVSEDTVEHNGIFCGCIKEILVCTV